MMLKPRFSFQGKVVAITGASGTMGRSLIRELTRQGAQVIALTTSQTAEFEPSVKVLRWVPGQEADLADLLQEVDILVINHGINVYGDRSPAAIAKSYEVNTFSAWRLAELFLNPVVAASPLPTQGSLKELWINTSEAEVSPALSPLYELSKRTLGDLITLRRLDAPSCVMRKLILGPFKSNLNPYGVMAPDWVARMIVRLAKLGFRDIIVTVNPITYVAFPLQQVAKSFYFWLFTQA